MSEPEAHASESCAPRGALSAGALRAVVLRRITTVLVSVVLLAVAAITVPGCGGHIKPLFRMGSCFGSITKVNFRDLNELGRHGGIERNGMVGTCRGGFIDLAHLRNAADLTRWLAKDIQAKMIKGRSRHSFTLTDPSRHYIEITYPENWNDLPESEREAIARDI